MTVSHTTTVSDGQLTEVFGPVFARISEDAADRDNRRELPTEAIALLRNAGFGTVRVPVDRGGFGATLRQTFSLLIDLAAADPNLTQALRVHFSTVEGFLAAVDSTDPSAADAAEAGLHAVVNGTLFGNAISERGVGAAERYQTTLTRRGTDGADTDGYVLNGTKYYSTGSLFADVIVVAADLDGERVTVTVPVTAEGVHQIDDWDGFGQRVTGSGTTVFDNVTVGSDVVTAGGYGTGGRTPETAFLQLFHLAALSGIARRAADDARDHVAGRERTYSHAPADLPREDPLVQAVLGRINAAAFTARATTLAVADLIGQAVNGTDGQVDAAELAAAEAQVALIPLVLDAANELFETGGASLASGALNLDRHWRNARTLAQHNPAVYKQQAIGKYALTGDSSALPFAWSAGVRGVPEVPFTP
ncbi:acyl-CoA dehydrogenase family protein [Corynebacterium glyciniphilum]|uniref:Acyl-CoA dehydrogenase type 2 domain-containing protein n=1 Tax=Corynebacterium glyciniphilum AJ 3170 TaxID=1404245 RepID=X5DJB0_9CORY|nr:acyl-CoA dehydrogenase family protein [Corynebacterium glyciniphilum]AHW63173.1 Acyl-CoA dehydrogenase type 2 domain-containing protein [Corynebacterium glyciniphilum AJ 3170]